MSTSSLDKAIEYLSRMLNERVTIPTHYSEAYLSGRDLTPMHTNIPQRPQTVQRKEGECSHTKPIHRPKRVVRKKEDVKEKISNLQPQAVDWSDFISKDVQSMNRGFPYNSPSDAYIVNMAPELIHFYMAFKFGNPIQNIKDSISRCGVDNSSHSLETEAINNENLKLSIRNSVGKVIKRKITQMQNVPDELKKDIVAVFG